MPHTFVTEFNQSPSPSPQHDLLARLYREIGLSAVAAALDVVNSAPAPAENKSAADQRQIPAILRDDIAA